MHLHVATRRCRCSGHGQRLSDDQRALGAVSFRLQIRVFLAVPGVNRCCVGVDACHYAHRRCAAGQSLVGCGNIGGAASWWEVLAKRYQAHVARRKCLKCPRFLARKQYDHVCDICAMMHHTTAMILGGAALLPFLSLGCNSDLGNVLAFQLPRIGMPVGLAAQHIDISPFYHQEMTLTHAPNTPLSTGQRHPEVQEAHIPCHRPLPARARAWTEAAGQDHSRRRQGWHRSVPGGFCYWGSAPI